MLNLAIGFESKEYLEIYDSEGKEFEGIKILLHPQSISQTGLKISVDEWTVSFNNVVTADHTFAHLRMALMDDHTQLFII